MDPSSRNHHPTEKGRGLDPGTTGRQSGPSAGGGAGGKQPDLRGFSWTATTARLQQQPNKTIDDTWSSGQDRNREAAPWQPLARGPAASVSSKGSITHPPAEPFTVLKNTTTRRLDDLPRVRFDFSLHTPAMGNSPSPPAKRDEENVPPDNHMMASACGSGGDLKRPRLGEKEEEKAALRGLMKGPGADAKKRLLSVTITAPPQGKPPPIEPSASTAVAHSSSSSSALPYAPMPPPHPPAPPPPLPQPSEESSCPHLPQAPPPSSPPPPRPRIDPADLEILNNSDFLAAFLDDSNSPPPPMTEAPAMAPIPDPATEQMALPPMMTETSSSVAVMMETDMVGPTTAARSPLPLGAPPSSLAPNGGGPAMEEDDFDPEWTAAAIMLSEAHERRLSEQQQPPEPEPEPSPSPSTDDLAWAAAAISLLEAHEQRLREQQGPEAPPMQVDGQQPPPPAHGPTAPAPHHPQAGVGGGGRPDGLPPRPCPPASSSSSSQRPRSRAVAPQQIKAVIAGGRGYDNRRKRHYYTSLTGERIDGAAAIKARMKEDEAILARGQDFDSMRGSLACSSSTPGSVSDTPPAPSFKDLTHWVPPIVADAYKTKGITELFPWQVECLQQVYGAEVGSQRVNAPGTESQLRAHPQNLVYSAPTSGGKTLVAEILLLKALVDRGGAALFVQPYIALVEEKARHFRQVWKELQISVQTLHGEAGSFLDDDHPDIQRSHVVVSTIERANAQVNRLLERGAGDRLSFVVVDELHMVGGKERGYLIELMLAKLRKAAPHVQIVGMSATLINLPEVAQWLGARLYKCETRPVNLSHFLCEGGRLRRHDPRRPGGWHVMGPVRYAERYVAVEKDPQLRALLHLCQETASQKKGVLVFCPVKKWTITLANILANNLMLTPPGGEDPRRAEVCLRLQQTAVGLTEDDPLAFTVPRGVAHHNADLTLEQRDIVEAAFRDGDILVLVCTSTLAAGVNLPAARVIIRSPKIGNQELDVTRFRQMCGRAGRLGLDTEGEAYLMIDDPQYRTLGETLVTKELPPITSELESAVGGGIERAILEVVTARVARSPAEVVGFADYTLLHAQDQYREPQKVNGHFREALKKLVGSKFLEERRLRRQPVPGSAGSEPVEEEEVVCTQLGQATFFSSLSPSDALIVLRSLEVARKKLILTSDLHAVFLVTPTAGLCLAREQYQQLISQLAITTCMEVREVLRAVGISFQYLYSVSRRGAEGADKGQGELCQRFIAALALFHLIQPTPIPEVQSLLKDLIPAGKMQRLQADAETMTGMVVCFCRHLKWDSLASLLATFQDRLAFGVPENHVQIVKLGADIIHRARAKVLYDHGFKTLEDLASTTIPVLARALSESRPYGDDQLGAKSIRRLSETIIQRAKVALLKSVEEGGVGSMPPPPPPPPKAR